MLLLSIDNLEVDRRKKELIVFTFFLVFFINILIYRKAFLFHGFNYVFSPFIQETNNAFFADFNIFSSIISLGLVVFILGIIGLFFGYFREKNDVVILLSGFIVAALFAGILRLINVEIVLLILLVCLAAISSLAISRFFNYLKITKISSFKNYLFLLFFILIVIFSVYPSFAVAKSFNVNNNNLDDLNWLRDNSDKNSVVLSSIEDGDYVIGLADRKSVLGSDIMFVAGLEQRVKDVSVIYTTFSSAIAIDLIKKYNVNYIYFSEQAKNKYKITEIFYIKDEKCFEKQRESIYKVKC